MKLYGDCDYLNELRDDEFAPDDGNCEHCMRYDICLENFIRDNHHDPSEHGDPLTLEQLAERIGKKVWVQSPGVTEYGRVAVVEDVDLEYGVLFLANDFTCHNYGTIWEAYDA